MNYQIDDAYSTYAPIWRDDTENELSEIVKKAADYNSKSISEIRVMLESGKTVSYAQQLNYYNTHREMRIRKFRAPQLSPEMVRCSCGHSVPRGSVMSASMGSSCPECYDRMSA